MMLRIGLLSLLLVAEVNYLFAAPVAQLQAEGITITVTDEPCKLSAVANLPHRATWEEKGKKFEGCAGGHPLGLIMFYFDDKSVAVAPIRAFQPVKSL